MHSESGRLVIESGMAAFSNEVGKHSGENLNRCFHCRTCAGGCPFSADMDYAPHGVFRLVQFNMRRAALECGTIWICVGCHTCSVQCPAAIDIAAIMDTLRQMALAENVKIAEPRILDFHREDNGGDLTLRVKQVDEKKFCFQIEDTGKGIRKEDLERIFDPFYTTKEVGKGTGLGLSISHGIVEKHGGRIEVESQVGVGTVFTVCLPIECEIS